jgi:hypothetical protein
VSERFVRLAADAAGGLKLAARRDVSALPPDTAQDERHFGERLRRAFGEPDRNRDAAYAYAIRDTETGVIVRAYSAQSGPAYGGEPDDCFVDYAGGDYRLKPDVRRTLTELDAWLEQP